MTQLLLARNPWLKTSKLVAKPDQMIGGRGKAGLIAVNKSFEEIKARSMGLIPPDPRRFRSRKPAVLRTQGGSLETGKRITTH